jgi:hypothetical protein
MFGKVRLEEGTQKLCVFWVRTSLVSRGQMREAEPEVTKNDTLHLFGKYLHRQIAQP